MKTIITIAIAVMVLVALFAAVWATIAGLCIALGVVIWRFKP